jgi:hypothetical protein
MLPMSATSRGGPADESGGSPTRSAAAGMSLLAHAAAIGALLMLKPAPSLTTPPEAIEVTVVSEETLASTQANNLSGAIPRDALVDVPAAPLVSFMHPEVMPSASSQDWSDAANSWQPFHVASYPAFDLQTHVAVDRLAAALDCLAVRGSALGPSERSRRGYPPCPSDDPPLRAPAAALLPAYALQQRESGTHGSDYRTFTCDRCPQMQVRIDSHTLDWIMGFLH